MAHHQRDPGLERFWRKQVTRQARSGLGVRDFCRRHQLSEPSFYAWRRVIRQRDRLAAPAHHAEPAATATPAFLPVAIVDSPSRDTCDTCDEDAAIAIQLPDGTRLRVRLGCERRLLTDVLHALRTTAVPVPVSEGRPC